jgi:hypothetical protein
MDHTDLDRQLTDSCVIDELRLRATPGGIVAVVHAGESPLVQVDTFDWTEVRAYLERALAGAGSALGAVCTRSGSGDELRAYAIQLAGAGIQWRPVDPSLLRARWISAAPPEFPPTDF